MRSRAAPRERGPPLSAPESGARAWASTARTRRRNRPPTSSPSGAASRWPGAWGLPALRMGLVRASSCSMPIYLDANRTSSTCRSGDTAPAGSEHLAASNRRARPPPASTSARGETCRAVRSGRSRLVGAATSNGEAAPRPRVSLAEVGLLDHVAGEETRAAPRGRWPRGRPPGARGTRASRDRRSRDRTPRTRPCRRGSTARARGGSVDSRPSTIDARSAPPTRRAPRSRRASTPRRRAHGVLARRLEERQDHVVERTAPLRVRADHGVDSPQRRARRAPRSWPARCRPWARARPARRSSLRVGDVASTESSPAIASRTRPA